MSARKRQLVLLGVLAVGILLLGYDFYVARPACDAGYQEIMKLLGKSMAAKSDQAPLGPADVRNALGFGPSAKETKHDDWLIETYQWRGGLIFRTYKLYVVYKGLENPILQNVIQNEFPSEEVISPRRSEPTSEKPAAPKTPPADNANPEKPANDAPPPAKKQDGDA